MIFISDCLLATIELAHNNEENILPLVPEQEKVILGRDNFAQSSQTYPYSSVELRTHSSKVLKKEKKNTYIFMNGAESAANKGHLVLQAGTFTI